MLERRDRWMRGAIWGALSLLCLYGCGDDEDADGNAPPTTVTPRDAGNSMTGGNGGNGGMGGSGDDAGSDLEDGGIGEPQMDECSRVDAVPPEATTGRPQGSGVSLPTDFSVERVVATWEGNCKNPVLRIELSEGRCPMGSGHAAILRFEAKRILDGTVSKGKTLVGADDDGKGISIRYQRGRRELDPQGEWGTCEAPGSGEISLYDVLTLEAGEEIAGRFALATMADCTAEMNDPVDLTGAFVVTLERGLSDVCP